ncbi:hypothetical protein ONE63_001897 [Megalurothrips usitatus]|uniref:Uncharacterized protein n=1 Tax=Megalurothrips usitatus TaxID=439358 RepID=A0AAV7X9S2_9NEOP|nr:hypothetical protein ONE63_001897 [Megalurothrips usitatus]
MLVAGCEPYSTCTSSSSRHQEYLSREAVPAPSPQQQQQLDLALEGKSILLQQRAAPHPGAHPAPPPPPSTFSPLQLQLRIDLSGEQVVRPSAQEHVAAAPAAPLTRRQRAQLRRRQEQQKPADQVVFQRRTPTRPRTPAACPRTPLAMSTMSMPAAGQKFAADDAAANVFGSAEETSAAVKRLLAKSGTSVVEEHHRVTSSTKTSCDYLQDSFDFLHQRHMKNLSDVIARHQRQQLQQPPAPGQAPGDEQVHGRALQQLRQLQQQLLRHRRRQQVQLEQGVVQDVVLVVHLLLLHHLLHDPRAAVVQHQEADHQAVLLVQLAGLRGPHRHRRHAHAVYRQPRPGHGHRHRRRLHQEGEADHQSDLLVIRDLVQLGPAGPGRVQAERQVLQVQDRQEVGVGRQAGAHGRGQVRRDRRGGGGGLAGQARHHLQPRVLRGQPPVLLQRDCALRLVGAVLAQPVAQPQPPAGDARPLQRPLQGDQEAPDGEGVNVPVRRLTTSPKDCIISSYPLIF